MAERTEADALAIITGAATCDNCRHHFRDVGEEPCWSCSWGWQGSDSDCWHYEFELKWESIEDKEAGHG